MAGSYPDYPSYRMPYDRDGTQVFTVNTANNVTQRTPAEIVTLNNESEDGVMVFSSGVASGMLLFIFPELRDVDAFLYVQSPLASYSTDTGTYVETSVDTTNGLDGTWVLLHTLGTQNKTTTRPIFRTGIVSATATGIRALRIRSSTISLSSFYPSTVHLFGKPTAGQNPNRLILWHPTLNQRVGPAHFDWGDIQRGSAPADKTFRVKNNSATLTANSVTVSFDVLTDATPTLLGSQHTLSMDGTNFGTTASAGNIAPGALSGVVTMRRVTPTSAALSLWNARVIATATSWT